MCGLDVERYALGYGGLHIAHTNAGRSCIGSEFAHRVDIITRATYISWFSRGGRAYHFTPAHTKVVLKDVSLRDRWVTHCHGWLNHHTISSYTQGGTNAPQASVFIPS